ncbi:hypothetical protein GWI33_022120 [Rhynchophorus ferrugineus]|uniref:Uncharacterized protein n=1 Tax=Rhynchophorus ferrugineus TaxID=354439 RepID=A0A834MMS7_RHYFE|nr:hypothetical protein GWI33_022120 [Rhynchophorus ferrugineus]
MNRDINIHVNKRNNLFLTPTPLSSQNVQLHPTPIFLYTLNPVGIQITPAVADYRCRLGPKNEVESRRDVATRRETGGLDGDPVKLTGGEGGPGSKRERASFKANNGEFSPGKVRLRSLSLHDIFSTSASHRPPLASFGGSPAGSFSLLLDHLENFKRNQ